MFEKISVCIPVYNGEQTIKETVKSVLSQSYKQFELVIVDNVSTDNTVKIVKSIKDPRIKLFLNEKNVGCGGNLDVCRKKAKGDIIFYLSADDIADKYALQNVYDAFQLSKDIGIVTRPYFWFIKDIKKPVRIKKQFDKNQIISINDSFDKIMDVIATSDQISGIAFRKKFIETNFSNKQFIEMASMVSEVLKKKNAVILNKNIVAVRINEQNGSMKSSTYNNSPIMSWHNMVEKVYSNGKYDKLRKYLNENFVANNYIGLVQIKNYGTYKQLFREIYYLLKLRWKNIYSFHFWFFTIFTILIPRFILRFLVDFYKNKINSKIIKNISFNY